MSTKSSNLEDLARGAWRGAHELAGNKDVTEIASELYRNFNGMKTIQMQIRNSSTVI